MVLLSAAALASSATVQPRRPRLQYTESEPLPADFLLGAGTSAIQSEGAHDVDGRGESIIEYIMYHNMSDAPGSNWPAFVNPGRNADSYHMYKEDVAAAKALKLQVYRISISWPRIFPDGDVTKPNAKGVEFYKNFIEEICNAGMQPMVTMYHFDQPFEMLKRNLSWTNRDSSGIVDNFVDYADFLFATYGDKVKLWTTINEPNYYCISFAVLDIPGLYTRGIADEYNCIHNTVLAHAKVYRLYESKYRLKQGGQVGAAALTLWGRPNSTSWDDIEAADRLNIFGLGSIYHPLVYGEYPPIVRERVDRYSKQEGAADFLCFNAYFGSRIVDGTHQPRPRYGRVVNDRDAIELEAAMVNGSRDFRYMFMKPEPSVLWEASRWIWRNYKLPVFITENGWGDERTNHDPRDDEPRMAYHSLYIRELLRAAKEEGVKVMGYIVWSLIDTYEFTGGFTRKFGLTHVDYEGGTLKRTLKKSASFFQEVAETRRVPVLEYTYVDEPVTDSPTSPPAPTAPAQAATTPSPSSASTAAHTPAVAVLVLLALARI
ncbi:hypothetical protein FOCC_FOCC012858, partial [Frankliniella occidentalis]